jgi:hypothetical protein
MNAALEVGLAAAVGCRPESKGEIPCSREHFPCYRHTNSLLRRAGKSAVNVQSTGTFAASSRPAKLRFAIFPCYFPCYQGILGGDRFATDWIVSQPVRSLRAISVFWRNGGPVRHLAVSSVRKVAFIRTQTANLSRRSPVAEFGYPDLFGGDSVRDWGDSFDICDGPCGQSFGSKRYSLLRRQRVQSRHGEESVIQRF